MQLTHNVNLPNHFGLTFGELNQLELPMPEHIIFGLPRRQVATLNAVTNGFKSTIVRNLCIDVSVGRPLYPLSYASTPQRVVLLDFEDSIEELRSDLNTMSSVLSENEIKLLNKNLHVFCEQVCSDEASMCLSDPTHFNELLQRLQGLKPDLVVVDTMSSAFRIRDENSNAIMTNEVMAPLKKIARDANCGLLVTHHIGKSQLEYGQTRTAFHKARGASSVAGQSRLIMNLEPRSDRSTLVLECAKSKGPHFPTTVFTVDPRTRRLQQVKSIEKPSAETTILDKLEPARTYTTGEMRDLFRNIHPRTLYRKVEHFVELGKLHKLGHGRYRKVTNGH